MQRSETRVRKVLDSSRKRKKRKSSGFYQAVAEVTPAAPAPGVTTVAARNGLVVYMFYICFIYVLLESNTDKSTRAQKKPKVKAKVL